MHNSVGREHTTLNSFFDFSRDIMKECKGVVMDGCQESNDFM